MLSLGGRVGQRAGAGIAKRPRAPLVNPVSAANKDAMPYILMFGALMLLTMLVSCLAVV